MTENGNSTSLSEPEARSYGKDVRVAEVVDERSQWQKTLESLERDHDHASLRLDCQLATEALGRFELFGNRLPWGEVQETLFESRGSWGGIGTASEVQERVEKPLKRAPLAGWYQRNTSWRWPDFRAIQNVLADFEAASASLYLEDWDSRQQMAQSINRLQDIRNQFLDDLTVKLSGGEPASGPVYGSAEALSKVNDYIDGLDMIHEGQLEVADLEQSLASYRACICLSSELLRTNGQLDQRAQALSQIAD